MKNFLVLIPNILGGILFAKNKQKDAITELLHTKFKAYKHCLFFLNYQPLTSFCFKYVYALK